VLQVLPYVLESKGAKAENIFVDPPRASARCGLSIPTHVHRLRAAGRTSGNNIINTITPASDASRALALRFGSCVWARLLPSLSQKACARSALFILLFICLFS